MRPRAPASCAETAWRMMTKRDPHGNIVRGTIAALAAAIGGADAVTVLPFSAALGAPDAFARRIARNTQTILIEESNLHRVADPAAGSGAIEALTDPLCQTAWWFFQGIEQAGGAAEALETGLIQHVVAKVGAEREANVARRKDAIVGTSDFPDLHEDEVDVFGTTSPGSGWPRAQARSRVSGSPSPSSVCATGAMPISRRHGTRPKVFLACLGRPADFNARASFAKSLFEAGGIEAVEASDDNLAKRFEDSGAATRLPLLLGQGLCARGGRGGQGSGSRGAPSTSISPASPAPIAPRSRSAGIRTFLHQGCDTLAILNAAHDEDLTDDDAHPRIRRDEIRRCGRR